MTTEAPPIPVSWDQLAEVAAVPAPVAETIAAERSALTAVNTRLWEIEDAIGEKEAAQDFGDTFVALDSVYHENDERGRIEAAINRVLRSVLVEEKQYSRY